VFGIDASAIVERLRSPGETVFDDPRPDDVAIPLDDSVGRALFMRFVWKERRVNATVDDPRAAFAPILPIA